MKPVRDYLLPFLLLLTGSMAWLWLAFSIMAWQANPGSWPESTRMAYVILSAVVAVVLEPMLRHPVPRRADTATDGQCRVCHRSLFSNNRRAKYCSGACKQRAFRSREKQKQA